MCSMHFIFLALLSLPQMKTAFTEAMLRVAVAVFCAVQVQQYTVQPRIPLKGHYALQGAQKHSKDP